MNLILKLTDICNNSCMYCYEDLNKYGVMSINVLDSILSKLPKDELVHITYHGGEPLTVGKDYFRIIQSLIQKYKLNIVQSLQTNGLLIDNEWISLLNEYKISCSVSVDLDTARENEILIGKIKELVSNGLAVSTLSVIHKYNVKSLIKMYKELVSCGVTSIAFSNVYECPDLEPSLEELKYNYTLFYKFLLSKTDVIERTFLDNYLRYTNSDTTLMCNPEVCRYNFLTIYPNGDIYPCDRHSAKVYKLCNESELTTIQEAFDLESYCEFYNDSLNLQVDNCLSCDIASFCRTGCLCAHDIKNLRINNRECETYKIYYDILSELLGGVTWKD